MKIECFDCHPQPVHPHDVAFQLFVVFSHELPLPLEASFLGSLLKEARLRLKVVRLSAEHVSH